MKLSKFITVLVASALMATMMVTPTFAKSKKCDCGCGCGKDCKCSHHKDKDKDCEALWITMPDGNTYYYPQGDCSTYSYWQAPKPQYYCPPQPTTYGSGSFSSGSWTATYGATENVYQITAYPTGQNQVIYVQGLGNVLLDGNANVIAYGF